MKTYAQEARERINILGYMGDTAVIQTFHHDGLRYYDYVPRHKADRILRHIRQAYARSYRRWYRSVARKEREDENQ